MKKTLSCLAFLFLAVVSSTYAQDCKQCAILWNEYLQKGSQAQLTAYRKSCIKADSTQPDPSQVIITETAPCNNSFQQSALLKRNRASLWSCNVTAGDTVFWQTEQMARFPNGGNEAMIEYIRQTVKYPAESKSRNVSGRVFVEFLVDKKGDISNVKVVRRLDKYCDIAAYNVVKNMPRWEPGYHNGKPVKMLFTLPINFKGAN